MTVAVIIVAAGRGERAGGEIPKQYQTIGSRSVLRRTLDTFAGHPHIDLIQVVYRPSDAPLYEGSTKGLTLLPPVAGGNSRAASVLAGLNALKPHKPDSVLIHDAARCFVSKEEVSAVIDALKEGYDGALPTLPVTDSLKRSQEGHIVDDNIDRSYAYRALTPQGFSYAALLGAFQTQDIDAMTDDVAIATGAGLRVKMVTGSEENIKITTPHDFERAHAKEHNTMSKATTYEYRSATGFDVHRFDDGDHVVLCGIKIPHSHKLKGHSDADVAMHALTDALLGTISAGDIGDHFPPSDPQWSGVASEKFLKHAADLVAQKHGQITHVDITIICEAPKLMPYKTAMKESLATTLNLPTDRVSVKATTTEKLGFTGRKEGIAATASATIALPQDDFLLKGTQS